MSYSILYNGNVTVSLKSRVLDPEMKRKCDCNYCRKTHVRKNEKTFILLFGYIMKFIKPEKLKQGDTVGIVSPSWGGPSIFPHIYDSGIHVLEKMGFKIKEFPSARKDAEFLYNNPEFRAKDINDAFSD